jgi:hypothetical protein
VPKDAAVDSAETAQTPLSLEERKFIHESQSKGRELTLREREIVLKEAELLRSRWLNPTAIGLLAATFGLFGNLVVAFIGNRNSQQIEHSRAQSGLIVQAVSTGNASTACSNLRAFVRLGLLDDPNGTFSKCESSPESIPVLPSARTYNPVADTPFSDEMAPIVTVSEKGDSDHFEVTFTVPTSKSTTEKDPDLITVYAYQIDDQGKRSNNLSLPRVHGSWKVGDRVTITADLPKHYMSDSIRKSFLRYCVGTSQSCAPGPNLLLPRRQ